MEKFSQVRDKGKVPEAGLKILVLIELAGSGIAPFLPIPTEPSGVYLPFHVFLYVCRVPMVICMSLAYMIFLQWLPTLVKRAALWCILGIPGIWWIDLQIDGVKKG
jgi:1-acylglycerol-3-phosphate O-acyltransferase